MAVTDLVLIFPPVALPSEPPLGIATLAASLRRLGARVELVDANVEGLHHLVASVPDEAARDEAGRRALKLRARALAQLRSSVGYADRDRHHAAVGALRRTLAIADAEGAADVADYHHPGMSPFELSDLQRAAGGSACAYDAYFEGLAARVSERSPRVVGISINYLHQVLPGLALAGVLRRRLGPGVGIMAGGGLISSWRGRLDPGCLSPTVDRLVLGDGVAALARELGLPAPPPRWDPPDYTGLPWELYLAPVRIAPATTSVGCYWNACRYCPQAAVGQRYQTTFGDGLARAFEEICRRTGAGLVHVTDSAVPPANLRRLAALDGAVPWYGFGRFHADLTDLDFCRELRRGGCRMLKLGLESGSPRVLRRLNKGIDLTRASAALRALRRAGVAVYLYVMFGIPGERRDDAERTLAFVADHAPCIDFINVSLLNLPISTPPEPGLELRRVPRYGELSLYTGFEDREGWERREARLFLERDFRRHPAVGPILRRTPHVFGANHAPFFVGEG